MAQRDSIGCGTAIALAAVLVFAVATCSRDDDKDDRAGIGMASDAVAPEAQPPIDAATRKQCANLVQQAVDAGVVRQIDRGTNRMIVDEPGWRELGPDGRKAMVAGAACDWFGKRASELADNERVTVIGWQSGERLASSMGGLYDGR